MEFARAAATAGRSNGSGKMSSESEDVCGDAHAQVCCCGGVGEGAYGDEIYSGESVFADGFEVHVARGFDGDRGQGSADLLNRFLYLRWRHVVEEDGVCASG